MNNRETLKKYFVTGSLPTQKHFEDLIESTLNMQDEGFSRSPVHGVQISKLKDKETFLSFYSTPDADLALWSWSADATGRLVVRPGPASTPGEPVLTMQAPDPDGARARVGINNGKPEHELDVAGVVRMRGRLGGYVPPDYLDSQGRKSETGAEAESSIVADGEWHDITGRLRGCHAFEVMAGVGNENSGRYSLLHAVAMNTFDPRPWPFSFLDSKRGIRATTAFYDRRCDKLRLRWFNLNGKYGKHAEYCLQIKSNCAYPEQANGKATPIRCHITQLWFDPATQGAGK
jgi:hypothetical protein